jgi:hypothetical protein
MFCTFETLAKNYKKNYTDSTPTLSHPLPQFPLIPDCKTSRLHFIPLLWLSLKFWPGLIMCPHAESSKYHKTTEAAMLKKFPLLHTPLNCFPCSLHSGNLRESKVYPHDSPHQRQPWTWSATTATAKKWSSRVALLIHTF